MYLILFEIIVLLQSLSSSGFSVLNDDLPDFDWPTIYLYESQQWSLTGGWVQDTKYWRTTQKSRVDHKNGAVKSITELLTTGRKKTGINYKIHSETTKEFKNKYVCELTKGTKDDPITIDEILPSISRFEYSGKDEFEGSDVHKFILDRDESEDEVWEKSLWARSNSTGNYWIPVKFEVIKFNRWLGSLSEHFVEHYFNFNIQFNDSIVFDVNEYNCTETDKDTKNHDKVNKDLLGYERNEYLDHLFTKRIEEHNRKDSDFVVGVNKFADRTPEEIDKLKGLLRRSEVEIAAMPFPYTPVQIKEISDTLPKEFDLRLKGLITPVQEQEDCKSSWTFGTTSAIEGAIARSNGGKLIRLSNQALIDCAWGFGASGCDGGSADNVYQMMMAHGLPTEEEYGPYSDQVGFCHMDNMTTLYTIKGVVHVTPLSVDALKVALVNHGPLSVSLNASPLLSLYTGGIFYDSMCNITNLDHQATLVGFDEVDGEEYWIVKNSWGINWGIGGYFHISTRDNSCGITSRPTYVVV